jgi:biopolymer transport protein ExbD
MATSSSETDGDHGFQIAPMVDVVFVLLLFFMACAGLKQVERHLDIDIPATGVPREIPLVVSITADGAVSVSSLPLAAADDESLARLRAWFAQMPSDEIVISPVVMQPSADTQHGRFVQVLALLNRMGFKKIAFA